MAGPTNVLFREGFGKWFRTKGFLMVLAVGLIPPALTAAWVGTHDADLSVTNIAWLPEDPVAGDNITFDITVLNDHDAAADAFNVTLRVGFYQQSAGQIRWRDVFNESMRVDGLEPGQRTTVSATWASEAGTFQVEAFVDTFASEIPEIEELNNYRPTQIQVEYQQARPELPDRTEPTNGTNETRPDAEFVVGDLTWEPTDMFQNDNVTFTVPVTNEGPEAADNITVSFQVYSIAINQMGQASITGVPFDETRTVALEAGATEELEFRMDRIRTGVYYASALVDGSAASRSDNESNNVVGQQFDVQRRLVWEEPEPGATAKEFYRSQVLLPLHFTLLVPLIGLFFAGGVLQDERNRGNLVYILTRPVPRWSLPLSRFATGFLVSLVAVAAGVILTWLLLKSTPQTTAGFLWWPLVFAVIVLLLYSAVFTFVGVVSDRPYLVGLLYILGFESLILAGRRIVVNGQPIVQDWLLNLSLMHWVSEAFAGWDPSGGHLLPQGDDPVQAFFVIGAIIVVSLVGAMWAATRREFPQ